MSERSAEAWFERRRLTLDIAGLTEQERKDGSIFLGGSIAEFVTPSDDFEYSQINSIVFRWSDSEAQDFIAKMLEHDDNPDESYYFPFGAATVISGSLWHLAVQDRDFDPTSAYFSDTQYFVLPYDSNADDRLQEYFMLPAPRPQLIGKAGQRWMLFELGIDIGERDA